MLSARPREVEALALTPSHLYVSHGDSVELLSYHRFTLSELTSQPLFTIALPNEERVTRITQCAPANDARDVVVVCAWNSVSLCEDGVSVWRTVVDTRFLHNAVSVSGFVVAVSWDHEGFLMDAATGAMVRQIALGDSCFGLCALPARDGRAASFVTGTDLGVVQEWGVDGQPRGGPRQFEGWVRAIVLSPCGTRMAVGASQGGLTLVELPSWATVWAVRHRTSDESFENHCLAFSGNGLYLFAGCDEMIRVHSVATGQVVRVFEDNQRMAGQAVKSLCLSPDGTAVVFSCINKNQFGGSSLLCSWRPNGPWERALLPIAAQVPSSDPFLRGALKEVVERARRLMTVV